MFRVITYHQSGNERGNREFVIECGDIETARERKAFYDNEAVNDSLKPIIQKFRESDIRKGFYDWFFHES